MLRLFVLESAPDRSVGHRFGFTQEPLHEPASVAQSPSFTAGGHVGVAGQSAVLLDSRPLWLEAVEAVLEGMDIEVAAKLTSATATLEYVGEHRPALMIADLEAMAGPVDGMGFIARCRAQNPGMKLIVLSADARLGSIEAALLAGASAYVLKSAHPDDLASAIRQAFDASIFLAPPQPVPGSVKRRSSPLDEVGLTRREAEILRLAAEGRSNGELARLLWVSEQTIKFHLSNVYRKLGVANRTEAALWAHTSGLFDTVTPQLIGVGP
jgi:DNA-binding NarL/FixJ family response regulator